MAALAGISPDYYSKIEQPRGPVPSDQVLSALARALALTRAERDHLLVLAGHVPPAPWTGSPHVDAGIMRVLARLQDTPAYVAGALGETLVQTPPAVALLGDETHHTGPRRSRIYRWFTDPEERARTPEEDHGRHSTAMVGHLVSVSADSRLRPPIAQLVRELSAGSDEFAQLWAQKPLAGPNCESKRILHPELGVIDLYGQTLFDVDEHQALTVFTAEAGSVSDDKLRLLSTVGAQQLR